jgi:hypothetical protein
MNVTVGSYYHALEKSRLQNSDVVVPIAHDYLGILSESWDVDLRQCMVVPYWFPPRPAIARR